MFQNTEHLPQVLTSEEYTSPHQFEREKQLFAPCWHLVATISDIPKDGDFRTLEILGQPLLVWNSAGGFHTFLNVCPHRFSRISGQPSGCSPDRLHCQYHGWEFDETGRTRKIPDAPSFKPLVQGELGLKRYRTELCGQLIFCSFLDEGPSLKDTLGELFPIAEELCGTQRLQAAAMQLEYNVNWKIKIENSLESYHLSEVHKGTFGRTPEPEICKHELMPNWTGFETHQPAATPWQQKLDDFTHKLVHTENDHMFRHYIFYPHFMFGRARLFSWAETVYPISAGRTHNVMRLFSHKSRSGKLKSRILCKILATWGRKYFTKVAYEDLAIINEVQKGHESPRRPSQGLVSVREERCFHFQEWVKNSTRPEAEAVERGGNGKHYMPDAPHFHTHTTAEMPLNSSTYERLTD